jgi:hypothetical protein
MAGSTKLQFEHHWNMKTLFDKTTRDELITRINTVTDNSAAQWGKMTACQMLKHCALFEEMTLGRMKTKRAFIGLLFGKMALKGFLKDGKLMTRNSPTAKELITTGNGNITAEKANWITLMGEYEHFSNPDFVHPFFGKMTKEQIGYMAYKHADHHLRQFNA